MPHRLLLAALLACLAPLAACDSEPDGADALAQVGSDEGRAGETDTAATADVPGEDTGPALVDTAPADEVAPPVDATSAEEATASDAATEVTTEVTEAPDTAGPPPYPEGPYGVNKFDIIEDLSLFNPVSGRWIWLHDYYQLPEVKVLLITSSAGWCGPCFDEAKAFVDYYAEYKPLGLEILYTLYEDQYGNAMYGQDDWETAHDAFVEQWRSETGMTYPLFADIGHKLSKYFYEDGIPFAIMVTTDNMQLRFLGHGYSPVFIENKLELLLKY